MKLFGEAERGSGSATSLFLASLLILATVTIAGISIASQGTGSYGGVDMVQSIVCYGFSTSACAQSFYNTFSPGDVIVVNVWLYGYGQGCGTASVTDALDEAFSLNVQSGCDNFSGDSISVLQYSASVPMSASLGDVDDTITVTDSQTGSSIAFVTYDVSGISPSPSCTASAYASDTPSSLPIAASSGCMLPPVYFATSIARVATRNVYLTAGTEEGWETSQCQYANYATSEWATSGLTSPTAFRFDGAGSFCGSESSEYYSEGFVLVGGVYPPAGGTSSTSSPTTTSAAETVTTTVTLPPSPGTGYSSSDITLLGLAFAIAVSGISIGVGLGRRKPT